MFKSTFLIASTLAVFSSMVVAQTPTLPANIPSAAAAVYSSLAANPGGLESAIASVSQLIGLLPTQEASQIIGSLPTQYQAAANSAYSSVLSSEASKTLVSVPQATQSSSASNNKPAVAVAVAVAVAMMAGTAAAAALM